MDIRSSVRPRDSKNVDSPFACQAKVNNTLEKMLKNRIAKLLNRKILFPRVLLFYCYE